jgi:CRISPR-associated protein Cas5h
MKVLVFDIFGEFAHFRKFYTTSSPLSFPFPPPPTIFGMLGAILGIDRKEYLETFSFENCKIALQIVNPIKKIRLGLNLINTKGNIWIPLKKKNHDARTQVKTEFIRDPRYRIYFYHENEELFNKLAENIKNHKSYYTFSLGLSELLGDFQFMGIKEFTEKENGEIYVSTLIPISLILENKIIFEEGKSYFRERIPLIMNSNRIVERYEDVIFESQGNSIKVKVDKYYQGDDGTNVIFL